MRLHILKSQSPKANKKGQAVAYNIKPHLRCINEKNKTLKLTGK